MVQLPAEGVSGSTVHTPLPTIVQKRKIPKYTIALSKKDA